MYTSVTITPLHHQSLNWTKTTKECSTTWVIRNNNDINPMAESLIYSSVISFRHIQQHAGWYTKGSSTEKDGKVHSSCTNIRENTNCQEGNPHTAKTTFWVTLKLSDDVRENAFLFRRLSVLIQRFNSVAVQGIFAHIPSYSSILCS